MDKWKDYSNLHANLNAVHTRLEAGGDASAAVAKVNEGLQTVSSWNAQLGPRYKYPVLEFTIDVCFYVRLRHDVRSLVLDPDPTRQLHSAESSAAGQLIDLWVGDTATDGWHRSAVDYLTDRVSVQWHLCDDTSKHDVLSLMQLVVPYFKQNSTEIIALLDHVSTSILMRSELSVAPAKPLSDQARELLLIWFELAMQYYEDNSFAYDFYARLKSLFVHIVSHMERSSVRDTLGRFVVAVRGIRIPLDRGKRIDAGLAELQERLDELGALLDETEKSCAAVIRPFVRSCRIGLMPHINGRAQREIRYEPGEAVATMTLPGEQPVRIALVDVDSKNYAGVAIAFTQPLDKARLFQPNGHHELDVTLTFPLPNRPITVASFRATVARFWPVEAHLPAEGAAVTLIPRRPGGQETDEERATVADWLRYVRLQSRRPDPAVID